MILWKKHQLPGMKRGQNRYAIGAWLTMCLTLVLVGCGSETTDSGVVEPPTPVDTESMPSAEPDSPGGMELPPGEIPSTSESQESEGDAGIEMPKDVAVPKEAGATALPAVEYGSWEEIEKLARSTGRVTVVDLWSLACEPCLKEFPGLVELHEKLGSSVQCIAVDLDFDGRKSRPPEQYEEQVIAFLQSVGASGFPMYISSTPSDDVFATAELVSIPAVLIFDADGSIAMKFVDAGKTAGFTYKKDIIPLVTKLAG